MTDRPMRGLRGEHVYLRPLEPEDADLVAGWYADDRFRKLMGDLPTSLARRRRRYEDAVTGDGDDVFRFIVCRLDDDRPVGRTDLFDIDRTNGRCAFGISIGEPGLRGQGLGTDAVDAIVDFAFGELRMERVWLDTDADNLRRPGGYRKAGFAEEGRLRHAWFQDGRYLDGVRMAILRDEWLALPRPQELGAPGRGRQRGWRGGDLSPRVAPGRPARSARPSGRTARRSGAGRRPRRGPGPWPPPARGRRCRRTAIDALGAQPRHRRVVRDDRGAAGAGSP